MVVTNKQDLQKAIDGKVDSITVEGDFAKEVHQTRKLATLGKVAIAAIIASIGLAPVTAGFSTIGLGVVATVTGMEIAAIICIAIIGAALLIALYKEYEVIEFDPGPPPRLVLRKKG